MLKVSQLTRRYGDFIAVDQVSFNIDRGEIVGLLGHNGAGKTTIMKMLSGYLEPHKGTISIGELELASHTKDLQRDLGYLPESLPIYQDMAVADYLDFSAELKGLQGANRREELRRAIAATELQEKLLSPIATLSRGFKQRLGVAQAILGRPGLLILDEPTNGLDPTQTEHMRALIRELASDATVILSTHIMQEVDALCDRVLILRAGRMAVDAGLDELRRSNRVLLSTSLSSELAHRCLNEVTGVHSVASATSADGAAMEYTVDLRADATGQAVCAGIARAVHDAGAELFSLQPEHRDLETLFREVSTAPGNTGGDFVHAA